MAWIEVHQSLRGHKKLSKLCELLNIKCEAHAVGYLVCLWLWAVDNAPDGNLEGISDKIIANAAAFPGEKKPKFVDALMESGFLNKERALHNWLDYAGRLIERRQANAERMRSARHKTKDETEGKESVACAARAGLPYPTVPNRTQPDHTLPDQDLEGRNNQLLLDSARERVPVNRRVKARFMWMLSMQDFCRDACGKDAEKLVHWLFYESAATDDQIGCALDYMQKRHLAGNLRKPVEYVRALIDDWQNRSLDTRDDIERNREDFFA